MDAAKPELPLAMILKFAGQVLARVEAIEEVLIKKGIASKEEIEEANGARQRRKAPTLRAEYRDETEFERALPDILRHLRG